MCFGVSGILLFIYFKPYTPCCTPPLWSPCFLSGQHSAELSMWGRACKHPTTTVLLPVLGQCCCRTSTRHWAWSRWTSGAWPRRRAGGGRRTRPWTTLTRSSTRPWTSTRRGGGVRAAVGPCLRTSGVCVPVRIIIQEVCMARHCTPPRASHIMYIMCVLYGLECTVTKNRCCTYRVWVIILIIISGCSIGV